MQDNLGIDIGAVHQPSPIELVRHGMRVVDLAGQEVGTVERVKMGDPEAVTTRGEEIRPAGLLDTVAEAFVPDEAEPDVPEPLRARLVREGFVKIDGPGLTDTDRYVSAKHIGAVSGDTVQLTVHKDQLHKER